MWTAAQWSAGARGIEVSAASEASRHGYSLSATDVSGEGVCLIKTFIHLDVV